MSGTCKDCKTEVHAFNGTMVMITDALWMRVCDDWLDVLCSDCMQKRMGRFITSCDFKPSSVDPGERIPVNAMWLEYKPERQ